MTDVARGRIALTDKLGVVIDPELLSLALTHRSWAYEHGQGPHNERLEFLGDSILGQAVTVRLFTDSTYVRNGITKWVLGWERNGWKTSAKQPVKNVDLWQRLQAACARHHVEWFWVKGHAGVADNELADELATRGMQKAMDPAGEGRDAAAAE